MNEIGDKINQLRKTKGLSQEELGFEIGVSRQAISKWENGTILPSTENLKSICKFFNVSMDDFILNNESATTETATSEVQKQEVPVFENPVEDINKKDNRLKKFLIIGILSVFTVFFIVFTVIIGFIIFQPRNGAVSVTSVQFNNWHFIVCIVLGIILLTFLVVYLCIYFNKNKK